MWRAASQPKQGQRKEADVNVNLVQVQGTNIRHYYTYILGRAKAFRETRIDWVRQGVGRLKRQTVDKGLLRETEAVQHQINSLLKCDVSRGEWESYSKAKLPR